MWEQDPKVQAEIQEARAAYESGDYVTIEEHVARRAGQTPEEILDALRSERQETVAFITDLPHDAWDRIGDHPALGEVSVRQVIRVIGVHERMHLKEIRRLLDAQKAGTG